MGSVHPGGRGVEMSLSSYEEMCIHADGKMDVRFTVLGSAHPQKLKMDVSFLVLRS